VTEFVRELTSPPDTVDDVHDLLDRLWSAEEAVSADDRMRFETALIELATNVVQHADPGTGVAWTVRVACDGGSLTGELVDTAPATEFDSTAEREMPAELAEDGRGLAFVRLLVDSATFASTDAGNTWRISTALPRPHGR
jgi:serine/threonine-protein kinase RsbW